MFTEKENNADAVIKITFQSRGNTFNFTKLRQRKLNQMWAIVNGYALKDAQGNDKNWSAQHLPLVYMAATEAPEENERVVTAKESIAGVLKRLTKYKKGRQPGQPVIRGLERDSMRIQGQNKPVIHIIFA